MSSKVVWWLRPVSGSDIVIGDKRLAFRALVMGHREPWGSSPGRTMTNIPGLPCYGWCLAPEQDGPTQ
jgi:hypothetical protein